MIERLDATDVWKIACAWAKQHTKDTGHQVWVHCRGWHDFHVECEACIDEKAQERA